MASRHDAARPIGQRARSHALMATVCLRLTAKDDAMEFPGGYVLHNLDPRSASAWRRAMTPLALLVSGARSHALIGGQLASYVFLLGINERGVKVSH